MWKLYENKEEGVVVEAVKVTPHFSGPDFCEGHLFRTGQLIRGVPIIVIGTFIWVRKRREGQKKDDQMGGPL